jgi:hypothetical protein
MEALVSSILEVQTLCAEPVIVPPVKYQRCHSKSASRICHQLVTEEISDFYEEGLNPEWGARIGQL